MSSAEEQARASRIAGQEGAIAYRRGEYRRAADLQLEAFQCLSNNKWHPNRYVFLQFFCSVLTGVYFKHSQADWNALKQIIKDESELKLIRALVALACGQIKWYQHHRHDDAGDYFRDAIHFAQSASAEEKETIIFNPDSGENCPAVEILSALVGWGRRFLDNLLDPAIDESRPNMFVKTESFLWGRGEGVDGSPLPEQGRQTRFCIGPKGVSIPHAGIRRLMTLGGQCCEACGMSRAEAEMVCLDCCSGCKVSSFLDYVLHDSSASIWHFLTEFLVAPSATISECTFVRGDANENSGVMAMPNIVEGQMRSVRATFSWCGVSRKSRVSMAKSSKSKVQLPIKQADGLSTSQVLKRPCPLRRKSFSYYAP
jgi:hypothetical protein